MRAMFLAVLAIGCDQGVPAPKPAPRALPPPLVARCEPLSTPTTYTVCVIDTAGHPIQGATVTATQTLLSEGLGQVLRTDSPIGTRITDASGRAQFEPFAESRGYMSSVRERSRSATGEARGWPRQVVDAHGFITLIAPAGIEL